MCGCTSHHMSYHTCPGCLSTQHHRLVYVLVRSSNLRSRMARLFSRQHPSSTQWMDYIYTVARADEDEVQASSGGSSSIT